MLKEHGMCNIQAVHLNKYLLLFVLFLFFRIYIFLIGKNSKMGFCFSFIRVSFTLICHMGEGEDQAIGRKVL